MSRIVAALVVVTALTGLTGPLTAQSPADVTQWRGAQRDGVITGFTEPAAWPEQLMRRWKVEVGTGYATPIVVGNRIYMFTRRADNETMSALDAQSGKELWSTGYPAPFTMNSGAAGHNAGPKSTPVFAGNRLYSIGMTGIVTAWDAQSGKPVWRKPGSTPVPLYTTHAFSPLIDRGLVIFHLGGHDQGALTALDVNTGDVKWRWAGDGPGYGSPVVADLGGTRQVITITQNKVVGVDAATGALLWERPFVVDYTNNSMTPIVYGQTVIVSNGGPTVAFTPTRQGARWTTPNAWENAEIPMRMSNGVIADDALVSLAIRNSGQYFAVDAKTGKTLWLSAGRQAGNAAIQRAGTVIFSLEDDGELVMMRSSRTAFQPLRRYKVADTDTWTQPAISGNRIFVKDVSSLTLWTLN
jgi:outer membrane protein assembly factor BamB